MLLFSSSMTEFFSEIRFELFSEMRFELFAFLSIECLSWVGLIFDVLLLNRSFLIDFGVCLGAGILSPFLLKIERLTLPDLLSLAHAA